MLYLLANDVIYIMFIYEIIRLEIHSWEYLNYLDHKVIIYLIIGMPSLIKGSVYILKVIFLFEEQGSSIVGLIIQILRYNIYFLIRFVYHTRNLLNERLKPAFEYKFSFWICVLVLWIYKGYCLVKKLVWNVRIKAFWYTKGINSIWQKKIKKK